MGELDDIRRCFEGLGYEPSGHRIHSLEELKPFIDCVQKIMGLSQRLNFTEHYRSQSKDSYKLESGIHRYKAKLDDLKDHEIRLYQEFFEQVKSGKLDFIKEPEIYSEYEYSAEWSFLFQGQHLGLKTRLLDWALSWDKSLLFAVDNEKNHGIDGNYWIFLVPKAWFIGTSNVGDFLKTHPLEINICKFINFPFFQNTAYLTGEENRWKQYGRFFVQDFESGIIPMEEQDNLKPLLFKFIIDGDSKATIMQELKERGIVMDSIYRTSDSIEGSLKSLNNKYLK